MTLDRAPPGLELVETDIVAPDRFLARQQPASNRADQLGLAPDYPAVRARRRQFVQSQPVRPSAPTPIEAYLYQRDSRTPGTSSRSGGDIGQYACRRRSGPADLVRRRSYLDLCGTGGAPRARMLVLPVRIELTTSALPRMRSTTELRQQGTSMLAPKARKRRGRRAYGQANAEGQGTFHGKRGSRSAGAAGRGAEGQSAAAQDAGARTGDNAFGRSAPKIVIPAKAGIHKHHRRAQPLRSGI